MVSDSSHKADHEFEKIFLELRKKENRVYSDAQVKVLPRAFAFNLHREEWNYRAIMSSMFLKYLKKHPEFVKILEIGCGNGWLCYRISNTFQREVFGIDSINVDLEQARRVFKKPNLTFINGDIFDDILPRNEFDLIVISNAIQFYPNLRQLIERSQLFLQNQGEIHIFDSPIYRWQEVETARKTTGDYYQSIQCPNMIAYHFHHSWDDFYPFKYKVLFDPKSPTNKIKKLLGSPIPPHPWIRIKKEG